MIYFDHNASTPLSAAAREAWLRAATEFFGNPSSPHRVGARAEKALEDARRSLAESLGCNPDQIVWTSGATESNNTAIRHLAHTRDGEAWISAIEHPCMIAALKREFEGRWQLMPVSSDGQVDMSWFDSHWGKASPACVAVMAANNETGALQPWQEISSACKERGIPFLCDAAQWIGKESAAHLGECDFVSGCAHKFGGPRGVGFLKCDGSLHPLLVGGPQEHGRRAGTENVPSILSMVAALNERIQFLGENSRIGLQQRANFERELESLFPACRIVARSVPRLWNTSMVIMPEPPDCRQQWVVRLDKLGLAVSTGSACASGKEVSSHVLRAMGYTDSEASRAIRISSGWQTDDSQWAALLDAIRQAFPTQRPAQ